MQPAARGDDARAGLRQADGIAALWQPSRFPRHRALRKGPNPWISPQDYVNFLLIGFLVAAVFMAPKAFRATRALLKHGPVEHNLHEMAEALLAALNSIGEIKTPRSRLQLIITPGAYGSVRCGLDGATRHETAVFLDAMQELLNPIDNPRYLIVRRSWFGSIRRRTDYHAVPAILGGTRQTADVFFREWRKRVGSAELVFTRSPQGRRRLLAARLDSLSSHFTDRCRRMSVWE